MFCPFWSQSRVLKAEAGVFVKACHLGQFNDCLAELKSDCHLIRSLSGWFFWLVIQMRVRYGRNRLKARANADCWSFLENSVTCKSQVFLLLT